jgi:hypothetical protein
MFNLLVKGGPRPVVASRKPGIIIHSKVDLDALGLGPYAQYFHKLNESKSTNDCDVSFKGKLIIKING